MKRTGASTNGPIRQRPPHSVNLVDDASLRSTLLYYCNAFKSKGIQWIESKPGIDGVIIIEAFSLEKHCSQ